MFARRLSFGVIAVALAVSLLNPARATAADPKDELSPQTFALTAATSITSLDGPLTRIEISDDLNCAVSHIDDLDPEFFGDTACATLVAIGGTLYGPAAIPAGSAASPRTPFTPVSQSAVTGSGSGADPYQIVTEVGLGSSGLRLIQTDSYAVGEESYRTDVELINDSANVQFATVYRAGDCYLQNSDYGFGAADAATGSVACIASDDGGQTPGARREEWIPITPGNSYIEAGYNEVWAAIGSQLALPNTDLGAEYIDNGAGLSWPVTPPSGGSRRVSHLTSFSPELVSAGLCLNGGTPEYVGADPGQPGITVWYDTQNLVDPRRSAYNEEAQLIAETIQERASSTLARYAQLGFSVPPQIEIFVICDVTFGRTAAVLGEDHVEISSDQFQTWFAPTVVTYSRGLGWHPPSATAAGWRNLIDHELFHTLQYKVSPVMWDWWRGDAVRREASATVAQDLVDATVDDTDLPQNDAYIRQTEDWFEFGPGPIGGPIINDQEYDAGVVLQYWGERYGPSSETDLEQRVADYLKALIETPFSVQLFALGRSLGFDYGNGTYPSPVGAEEAALDAYRELIVTSYVHAADNGDALPAYQFADEHIGHTGAVVASLPKYRDVPRLEDPHPTPASWTGEHLESGHALIYPADLPANAATATVSLSRGIDLSLAGQLRVAVVRERTDGTDRIIDVSDQLMARESGLPWEPLTLDGIDVSGWERLAVIVVGAPYGSRTYDLHVDTAGAPAAAPSEAQFSLQAMNGTLEIGADRGAGLPLVASLTLSDAAGPIEDATLVATITAPDQSSRRIYLNDEGLNDALVRHDGRFAGASWATQDAGIYAISVRATGIDNRGLPFDDTYTTSVTLSASPDSDADGVVDLLEDRLGLSSTDPADATIDHDADGLSLAAELAAGSSPLDGDTDGGGESDASEATGALDPGDPDDDRAVPSILLSGLPLDGNSVEVSAVATGAADEIELYRVAEGQRVNLGTFDAAAAVTVQDGPLLAGSYSYEAVGIAASGARSTPFAAGPFEARADATAPITRILVNEGDWETSSTIVSVRFVDLNEPVVEYRLATSREALDAAVWQPFAPAVEYGIGTALGEHPVYAQVRDAAGNVSEASSGIVFLEDSNPPLSAVDALASSYATSSIDVAYTASDELTGVASVELWWRYRPDAGAAWGTWTLGPSGTSSPVSFAFGAGPGLYEFYSVAVDEAGNREPAPALADAATEYVSAEPTTIRVSRHSNGNQGNGVSDNAWLSGDGRYVTFSSLADNLVDGDTNAAQDIFVYDRADDSTSRVSTGPAGEQANDRSMDSALNPDGSLVVFRSQASNLVSGDTNGGAWDIFVKDLATGSVERVNLSSSGAQANAASDDGVLSADGGVVAFMSGASNLVAADTNGANDVFVRDRASGLTTRVSLASDGTQANGPSEDASLSADGRYVSFWSEASNLVPGDTNGVRDVFVHDRSTGLTSRVSLASDGSQANGLSSKGVLSADGAFVAFHSAASNLVAGDSNAREDIFVHELVTGITSRVSLDSAGLQADKPSLTPKLSADGRYVAFYSTATNLVAGDTNNRGDIFVHDRLSGVTERRSLGEAGQQADNHADKPAISADGSVVAFESIASNLVAGDTNGSKDVFVRGVPY